MKRYSKLNISYTIILHRVNFFPKFIASRNFCND